jgi:hypothetical protein
LDAIAAAAPGGLRGRARELQSASRDQASLEGIEALGERADSPHAAETRMSPTGCGRGAHMGRSPVKVQLQKGVFAIFRRCEAPARANFWPSWLEKAEKTPRRRAGLC